ncbi:O-acetyl-ADP-ribose deacetylase [Chitinophagaceae bacterium MMS25-I14]
MAVIFVKKGDITKMQTDAIVNAANTSLLGGGGVDGAIHRAAGPELVMECRMLHGCKTGEAKITKGYRLPAAYVIHTVGPVWNGGGKNEEGLLYKAYYNSLLVAKTNAIKTIAFPNISTGIYRFPKDKAAVVALKAVKDFEIDFSEAISEIHFVCFDEENFRIYSDLRIEN